MAALVVVPVAEVAVYAFPQWGVAIQGPRFADTVYQIAKIAAAILPIDTMGNVIAELTRDRMSVEMIKEFAYRHVMLLIGT